MSSDTGGKNTRLARELVALRNSVGADVSDLVRAGGGSPSDGTVRNIEAGKNVTVSSVTGYVEACKSIARAKNLPIAAHRFDTGYWLRLRNDGETTPVFADWIAEQAASIRAPEAGNGPAPQEPLRGWPLDQVSDPFGSGVDVHRSITVDVAREKNPLTPYVRRAHDDALAELVEAARQGRSGMAVLVADSSAGKTRALWEALARLREEGGWRWWHPDESATPEAVQAFAGVTPRTVVWLNESQNYLGDTVSGDPQQLARRLRDLLADSSRAPVLVLGTLWREHYTALRRDHTRPVAKLVEAAEISVPDNFDGEDLAAMRAAAAEDPRLREAVEHAADGQITQYLAGGPELIARYEHGTAAMRAVVEVAMDAVRLGHRNRLPSMLLHDAAPYYMSDSAWNTRTDNWFEHALAELGESCKGAQGPITPLFDRPDPSHGGRPRPSADGDRPGADRVYYLTDYLAQYGRRLHRNVVPPIGFWEAVAVYAHPGDHGILAHAAWGRGMYRGAGQLWKSAVTHGDTDAACELVAHLHTVFPEDWRPAAWAAAEVSLEDPRGVGEVLNALRAVGASAQVAAFLTRNPAAEVDLDDPGGVGVLLRELREAGAVEQVAVLAARAAAEAAVKDPYGMGVLLRELREAGAVEQVAVLAARAAAEAAVKDPYGMGVLLRELREAGAVEQVAVLAARAAAEAAVKDPFWMGVLLSELREAGADGQVAALLARNPADEVDFDDPGGVGVLLRELRKVGADEQFAVLAAWAAVDVALDDLHGVGALLRELRGAGAVEQFAVLAARAAAEVTLDDPYGAGVLLEDLWALSAGGQVAALIARNPAAKVALDDPAGVGVLLSALWALGAGGQVAALIARNPAAEIALDDPAKLSVLLSALRAVGAGGQVAALIARNPAAEIALDEPAWVKMLLEDLRELGADDQANRLVDRLPTSGLFDLFLRERPENPEYFRFGREPEGAPAAPWAWDDLGTSH